MTMLLTGSKSKGKELTHRLLSSPSEALSFLSEGKADGTSVTVFKEGTVLFKVESGKVKYPDNLRNYHYL
jgi:hypothetical protein